MASWIRLGLAVTLTLLAVVISVCRSQNQYLDYASTAGCTGGDAPVNFPKRLNQTTEHYKYLEAGLTVFMTLQMPCDGLITYYTFLSSKTVIWGLHLALVRPTGATTFQVVGNTYINNWNTGRYPNSYVSWRVREGIIFKAGDYIAVFYDEQAKKHVSLRSAINPQFKSRTAVLYAQDLAVGRNVFSRTFGEETMREPALYVSANFLPAAALATFNPYAYTTQAPTTPFTYYTSQPSYSGTRITCTLTLKTTVYECRQVASIRFVYHAANRSCSELITCGWRTSNSIPAGFTTTGDLFCQFNCAASRKRRDTMWLH